MPKITNNYIEGIVTLLRPFYPRLTPEGFRKWLKYIPRGVMPETKATIPDAAKTFGMPISTLRLRVKQHDLQPVEKRPCQGGFSCYYQMEDLKRVSGMFHEDTTQEEETGQGPPA